MAARGRRGAAERCGRGGAARRHGGAVLARRLGLVVALGVEVEGSRVRRGQLKAGTRVWACVPEMEGRGDLGEVSGFAVAPARRGRETADRWGRPGSGSRGTRATHRRGRVEADVWGRAGSEGRSAHAVLSARGWAAAVGRAGQAARGGKGGVSWARGVGPGRWDGPRLGPGRGLGCCWVRAGFGFLFSGFLSPF